MARQLPIPPSVDDQTISPISLKDRLRLHETRLIRWALKQTNGNRSRAAELLQIKRSTLGDRIRRCGLHTIRDEDTNAQAHS